LGACLAAFARGVQSVGQGLGLGLVFFDGDLVAGVVQIPQRWFPGRLMFRQGKKTGRGSKRSTGGILSNSAFPLSPFVSSAATVTTSRCGPGDAGSVAYEMAALSIHPLYPMTF
jgi:hypothetical protein